MKFVLKEKTAKEIERERDEANFWAKRVKGEPDLDICPLQITTGSGKTLDVWALDEQSIVNLIDVCMSEMTDNGMKDPQKAKDVVKVISCWKEKHKDISVDMIEQFFSLEEKYKKYQGTLKDLIADMGMDKISNAHVIADYLNGMQGDKTEITSKNILKILRNQEMIQKQRLEKSQTV